MTTIKQNIKTHCDKKLYAAVFRQVDKDRILKTNGYIVDYSKDFVVLQETEDFRVLGYNIIPVRQIDEIRFNKNDKYYDKIMSAEGEKDKVINKHSLKLKSWQDIFKSIKSLGFNVIIKCENRKLDSFHIGPIKKITPEQVYIHYFNAAGHLDKKLTKINYTDISIVMFDDRYINVFSKYLKQTKNTS